MDVVVYIIVAVAFIVGRVAWSHRSDNLLPATTSTTPEGFTIEIVSHDEAEHRNDQPFVNITAVSLELNHEGLPTNLNVLWDERLITTPRNFELVGSSLHVQFDGNFRPAHFAVEELTVAGRVICHVADTWRARIFAQAMHAPSNAERATALETLQRHFPKSREAAGASESAFAEADLATRFAAAVFLGLEHAGFVIEQLCEPKLDPEARAQAVHRLAQLPLEPEQRRGLVRSALASEDEHIQIAGLRVIDGERFEGSADPLIESLATKGSAEVQMAVAKALGRIGMTSVDLLERMLQAESEDVVAAAASALGRLSATGSRLKILAARRNMPADSEARKIMSAVLQVLGGDNGDPVQLGELSVLEPKTTGAVSLTREAGNLGIAKKATTSDDHER